jgi:hypothetical protein
MKRALLFSVLLLMAAVFVFSQATVPLSLRDNQFLYESLRLNNLARLAYDEGDFLASETYAEEAIVFAAISDEYVRLRLKMAETDNAIAAAKDRLDYADSLNASVLYPSEYGRATGAYGEARAYRLAESWDNAIAAANQVLAALAGIDFDAILAGGILPSQYTVRPWQLSRDCLWNIAGRPWVYNDPYKWPLLFEANRSNMPEFDNPDLIHPGMVLNIPSIGGELRQGMWSADVDYPSF